MHFITKICKSLCLKIFSDGVNKNEHQETVYETVFNTVKKLLKNSIFLRDEMT